MRYSKNNSSNKGDSSAWEHEIIRKLIFLSPYVESNLTTEKFIKNITSNLMLHVETLFNVFI